MLYFKVLVCELLAVDRLAAGALFQRQHHASVESRIRHHLAYVTAGKVTALDHKVVNDAVEGGSSVAKSLLASAQRCKVFACSGNNVIVELEANNGRLCFQLCYTRYVNSRTARTLTRQRTIWTDFAKIFLVSFGVGIVVTAFGPGAHPLDLEPANGLVSLVFLGCRLLQTQEATYALTGSEVMVDAENDLVNWFEAMNWFATVKGVQAEREMVKDFERAEKVCRGRKMRGRILKLLSCCGWGSLVNPEAS
jgi:hypothetical protein